MHSLKSWNCIAWKHKACEHEVLHGCRVLLEMAEPAHTFIARTLLNGQQHSVKPMPKLVCLSQAALQMSISIILTAFVTETQVSA